MVIHCIKAGILNLTKKKLEALRHEYEGFQWWMQFGIDKGIYSSYKAAKGWKYPLDRIHYKTYPLVLRKQGMKYNKRDTYISPYWLRIKTKMQRGGIWVPINPQKALPPFEYLQDSQMLLNKKGNFELRLIYDVPTPLTTPKNIFAIDLGERTMATVCGSQGYIAFYGRDVRGVRRHFAWLRKRLGERKLLWKIRQIKDKERRIIQNKLHHITTQIVNDALTHNAIIVIGDLSGVRVKKPSKTLNRIVFAMPYGILTRMIQYKAAQRGIVCKLIGESFTSITCHKCGHCEKEQRKTQGLFVCSACKLNYNADLNAAKNILKRSEEQRFLDGALAEALKHSAIAEV